MRALAAAVALLLGSSFAASADASSTATVRIAGQRLSVLASQALQTLPANPDVEFHPAGEVPDQLVPAGHVTLTARTPLSTPYFVNVPIAIAVRGVTVRVVYVGYRATRYVHTAVAARDIAPGTVLTADDLTIARVPYTGWNANGTAVLIGRRTYAAFSAGQPIPIAQTRVNELVKAGSSVVMVVRNGAVALMADVVARTGGGLGDQVNVYNPQTNKNLSGTVTAPDRVELVLDPVGDMP
jgi:flagella basal body P-ring formation protein FlgA